MVDQNQKSLEKELRGLKDVLRVAQAVVSSLDLDRVLQTILVSAMEIVEAPAGGIALYDAPLHQCSMRAHAGLSRAFVSARHRWAVTPGGVTHQILETLAPVQVEDVHQAPRKSDPLLLQEGIRAVLAVPLTLKDNLVGILYLNDFIPRKFPEERTRLLVILASFAAMSIDNASLHQHMRHLACTDGLTGLYNHRQFKIMIKEEIARATRYGRPLALLMFDIDDFKKYNDSFGHPNGDVALAAVAGILRESMRESDMLFRYGGEEFIAILPETTPPNALIVAERARRQIAEKSPEYLAAIETPGVTISAGIVSYPRDGRNPETLLQVVDELLFLAKEKGKDRVYSLSDQD